MECSELLAIGEFHVVDTVHLLFCPDLFTGHRRGAIIWAWLSVRFRLLVVFAGAALVPWCRPEPDLRRCSSWVCSRSSHALALALRREAYDGLLNAHTIEMDDPWRSQAPLRLYGQWRHGELAFRGCGVLLFGSPHFKSPFQVTLRRSMTMFSHPACMRNVPTIKGSTVGSDGHIPRYRDDPDELMPNYLVVVPGAARRTLCIAHSVTQSVTVQCADGQAAHSTVRQ